MTSFSLLTWMLIACVLSPLTATGSVNHFEPRERLKFEKCANIEQCKLHGALIETLKATNKLLRISLANAHTLNVDGVAGIRSMSSQLDVLKQSIALRASPRFSAEVLNTIKEDIGYLADFARAICNIAIAELDKGGTEYLKKMWSILQDNFWRLDYSSRRIDSELVYRNRTLINDLDEARMDNCFANLTGIGKAPTLKCQLSDDCWNYVTVSGMGDYMITHQILYLEFGQMANCTETMEQFAVRHGQISVDHLLRTFCANVLQEMKDVETGGGPNDTRASDLYMEQAFLCGMLGFRDFFTMPRLRKILSQQKPEGCYGFSQKEFVRLKNTFGHPDGWYPQFSKREERLYGDADYQKLCHGYIDTCKGCLSHTTSVAAGVLAQYIRYLVEDPILQQTFLAIAV